VNGSPSQFLSIAALQRPINVQSLKGINQQDLALPSPSALVFVLEIARSSVCGISLTKPLLWA
jgi:hypothetical protein